MASVKPGDPRAEWVRRAKHLDSTGYFADYPSSRRREVLQKGFLGGWPPDRALIVAKQHVELGYEFRTEKFVNEMRDHFGLVGGDIRQALLDIVHFSLQTAGLPNLLEDPGSGRGKEAEDIVLVVSSADIRVGKERETMKCFRCGKGRLVRKAAEISGEVRGEAVSVCVEASVCERCGFQVLSNTESAAYGVMVADVYRERHGLLTSRELKAIRATLAMSQREFAAFLGVGVASVKRWEVGLIQDEAMDRLIRLATDPEAARANAEQLERRLGGRVGERRAGPRLKYSIKLRPRYAVFLAGDSAMTASTLMLAAA